MAYTLSDPVRAQRLRDLHGGDSSDLSAELALCKLLTEEAAEKGSLALAGQLLHITSKVSLTQIQAQERMGQLLSHHALAAVGRQICDQVVARLSHLPNYDQVVDAIIPIVFEAIEIAGHENKPLQLTQETQ